MKRFLLCLSLFAFFGSQAQQINPVPDYVFSNKMSVGRNAVTDTAAYFSIGPRYGAIRGMMPPMVTDTASMSATKRNGLLIFSIQKNKYLYWDSVGSKWAEMAGTTGSALTSGDTASMLSPYIRAAGNGLTKSGQSLLVDTAAIATRARVQKAVDSINANVALKVNISDTASMLTPYPRGAGVGNYMAEWINSRRIDTANMYYANGRFAIGSTTTTNGVFNVYSGQSYMDSTLKIGNGELIVGSTSSASRKLYVTSNSDVARFEQTASDKNMVIELRHTNPNASGTIREESINFLAPNTSTRGRITFYPSDTFNVRNYLAFFTPSGSGSNAERMRIANDGNVGIGTTSPSSLLEVNATSPRIRVVGTTGGAVNQYVTDGGQMFVGIDNSSASLFGNGAYSRVIYGGSAYPLDFYTNDLIRARITSAGELLIGTTTDAGAFALQVSGAIYNTTTITTGAPTSGSAKPWRLGEAATVSPTSPNRTIRVEIDGTVYYIHAKTTND